MWADQLHAQPYDISATGFFFDSADEFTAKIAKATNDYGDPVEEFEIQFIDGVAIDCALATAWGLNQVSFGSFFEAVDEWDDDTKTRYIIAVGECGYSHDQVADDPNRVDITLYELDTMRELAEQFVDEGIYGEIPDSLQFYIDYKAIARDLEMDHSQITIAGTDYIFHCA